MLFSFYSNFFILQDQAEAMHCFIYSMCSDLETRLGDFMINFVFLLPSFLGYLWWSKVNEYIFPDLIILIGLVKDITVYQIKYLYIKPDSYKFPLCTSCDLYLAHYILAYATWSGFCCISREYLLFLTIVVSSLMENTDPELCMWCTQRMAILSYVKKC